MICKNCGCEVEFPQKEMVMIFKKAGFIKNSKLLKCFACIKEDKCVLIGNNIFSTLYGGSIIRIVKNE